MNHSTVPSQKRRAEFLTRQNIQRIEPASSEPLNSGKEIWSFCEVCGARSGHQLSDKFLEIPIEEKSTSG
jgi:hypothetical protein